MSQDYVIAFTTIGYCPDLLRGEAYNVGILAWHCDTAEYAVEIDPTAIERAMWEQPRKPQWSAQDVASNCEEYIRNRIDTWAEKPLTSDSIRKWLDFPNFGTYCPLSVDSRRCGARFVKAYGPEITPLDVVREMSANVVRPPQRWKQIRAALAALPADE